MNRNEEKTRDLLECVGKGLSAGDSRGLSSCWEVPALFLCDEGAVVLADADQIDKRFEQAANWYRSRGLVSTRPELQRFDMLSEKLASVDVRWPAFDESGNEKSSERSHYILQVGKRVALTRTT
jgi:hypothetical protein